MGEELKRFTLAETDAMLAKLSGVEVIEYRYYSEVKSGRILRDVRFRYDGRVYLLNTLGFVEEAVDGVLVSLIDATFWLEGRLGIEREY